MVHEDFPNKELLSWKYFWVVHFSDGGIILTLRL